VRLRPRFGPVIGYDGTDFSATIAMRDGYALMEDKALNRTQEMTEAELIVNAQQGGERAFEELVRRYETKVFRLARRIVANAEDARDLAQDVFVRAFRTIHRVDPTRRFESWLYRITVNKCRTFLKRRRPEAPLAEPEAIVARTEEVTPDGAVGAMREAMCGLAPNYRVALVLFHQEGRSCQEISAMLNVSANRVRTWLHRGRRLVREAMVRKGYAPRGAS